MGRSHADRPYGSFRRLFPQDEAADTPQKIAWRERLRRLLGRSRSAQLVGLGAVSALLVAVIATSLSPGPRQLSEADVAAAIKQALASATPKPNIAITAFDNVKDSVVLIKTRLAGDSELRPRGSGVVMDTGETIITSLHILKDAAQISVVFSDGIETSAAVGDAFAEFDVAVLVTEMGGRKPAVMASARDLKVGDEAFVVGSPLGLSNSLSAGVISRLGSTFAPIDQSPSIVEKSNDDHGIGAEPPDRAVQPKSYGGLIQFNAIVYPGNSGGALVNRRGEVVGIVTWVASSTGVSGIGFAVPMDAAAQAPGSNPF